MTITPVRSDLVLHEPLALVLTIGNTGTQAAETDLGSDRKGAIIVESHSPDGTDKIARVRVHESVTRRGRITLAPGESYSQSLVIDEWTDLSVPGVYRIRVLLDNPIRMADGSVASASPITAIAVVGEKDQEALRHFCDDTLRNLLSANTYSAAVSAAEILSYVRDPIAVPYLRQGFQTPQPVHMVLAAGLEKIGSDDAIEALLQIVSTEPHSESAYLRNALERLATKTTNPSLRSRIQTALRAK